jgi:hypothetical protein
MAGVSQQLVKDVGMGVTLVVKLSQGARKLPILCVGTNQQVHTMLPDANGVQQLQLFAHACKVAGRCAWRSGQ